jgi:hypothetical protein
LLSFSFMISRRDFGRAAGPATEMSDDALKIVMRRRTAGTAPSTIRSHCRTAAILCDEGNYIAKLPKKDHDAPAWQAAMQALMLVAARGATSCCRGSASRGRSIRAT